MLVTLKENNPAHESDSLSVLLPVKLLKNKVGQKITILNSFVFVSSDCPGAFSSLHMIYFDYMQL